jgi:glycine hydroxymethyltransferase
LGRAHITINKNMVPFDTQSPFVTSGIRVGTAAVTTRGMKESDMAQIVDWIDAVICSPEDDAVIGRVGEAVRMRMRDLPLFEG